MHFWKIASSTTVYLEQTQSDAFFYNPQSTIVIVSTAYTTIRPNWAHPPPAMPFKEANVRDRTRRPDGDCDCA